MGKKLGSKLNVSPPDIGTRWLSLATLTTCASLAAFSSSGAYADTATQQNQRVGASLATNSVSISAGDAVNIEVIPSASGSLAVGSSTVRVTTDSSTGYQLYISGLNAETNGLTSMYHNGNVGSETKLTSIFANTPTAFSTANQWGYAVGGGVFAEESAYTSAATAGSITDRSTINNLTWQGVGKDMKLLRSDTASSPTTVYFGVYVNNDIMTGNYQNSVVYTAFVEGTSKLAIFPNVLKDGDTMSITAQYLSSTLPVTEASQIHISLLDGTTPVATCDNINITSDGRSGLLDFTCTVHTNANFVRNRRYDVALELSVPGRSDTLSFSSKYSWGDFDTLADVETMQDATALACMNSPVNTTYHLKDSRDDKSYLVTKLADGNCWMTQNLALAGGTTITPANSNVKADYTLPTSSTSGFNDNTKAYMYNGSTHQNNSANSTSHTGAYYSWLAAIAKNDGNYSAADMTALETTGAQAAYSICPKNWRLPLRDNGMIAVKNMYSLDEFRTLWNQGVTGTAPLVGNYGGGSLSNSGAYAFWWSRESSSAADARDMRQNSSGFGTNGSNRYFGFSVRCVLEVPKTFQDFTPADVATMSEDQTTSLMDARDGKQYLVSKLKDGNVWMTQNLALEGDTTITPADSDVRAAYTLPTSSTSGFSDNTKQYMFNGGGGNSANAHRDNTYDNQTTNTGAYYSWLTATANSGAGMSSGEAQYSICPKNWRLPSGAAAGQFKALYTATGGTFAGLNSVWHGALVGYYSNSSLYRSGSYGHWWSRTVSNSDRAYNMLQDSSSFNPENDYYKRVGFSVRCVYAP